MYVATILHLQMILKLRELNYHTALAVVSVTKNVLLLRKNAKIIRRRNKETGKRRLWQGSQQKAFLL